MFKSIKHRYYCTDKKGQVVFRGELEDLPSTYIKDDDTRVQNFFEPTPDGYRKVYTAEGIPSNEEIPPLNEDGTVNLKGNRLEELAKDEGDEYFEYYNLTPDGEGIYQADTAKSSQDVKDKRVIEIDVLLDAVDLKKIRPLSALKVATNQEDMDYLKGLESQSDALREERENLI